MFTSPCLNEEDKEDIEEDEMTPAEFGLWYFKQYLFKVRRDSG